MKLKTGARKCTALAMIAAAAVLAWPGLSSAGPGSAGPDAPRPGRIVGIVVDKDRHPVAGAQVALVSPAGEVVKRAETNAEGRYELQPVRPGLWLVRALKRDVGGDQERTGVRPGETARVPMQLHRP